MVWFPLVKSRVAEDSYRGHWLLPRLVTKVQCKLSPNKPAWMLGPVRRTTSAYPENRDRIRAVDRPNRAEIRPA